MMSIFIGGAWVYANGSLHLGHISTIRAKQEGVSPKEIADHYHQEFEEIFFKIRILIRYLYKNRYSPSS